MCMHLRIRSCVGDGSIRNQGNWEMEAKVRATSLWWSKKMACLNVSVLSFQFKTGKMMHAKTGKNQDLNNSEL